LLTTSAEPSDAELISAVRSGDAEAYGVLFAHHRDAANRLARQLVHGPDADDLVAESFIKVLSVLQAGKGPDESFRAYLLTSIRRLHIDRIRVTKRVKTTGDEAELDRAVEFVDPATMTFEKSAAAAAFASLPERWQLVLWHLDVEGQKPAEIAPLLGTSPNNVSALAYRAREGLRQAYLQGHLAPPLHEGCRKTTGLLGSYVRKGLSSRDTHAVESHLDECSRCTGLYLELAEVNSNLSGILGPIILGTAAAGYLAGGGAVAAGAAGAVGLKGAVAHAARTAFEPVKSVAAGAGAQGVVAVVVVAGLATVGTVAATGGFGGHQTNSARPAALATPLPTATPTAPPTPTPTPTPTSKPKLAPTAARVQAPTTTAPAPARPAASPHPTQTAAQKPPTHSTPPPSPTDYGVGSVTVTNESALLMHRITVPISAAASGRPGEHLVTLRIAFRHRVAIRGVLSPGWRCDNSYRRQSTLTCTKRLPAGQGSTFITQVRGIREVGVATVSAAGDPNPANNSAAFRSGIWLPL